MIAPDNDLDHEFIERILSGNSFTPAFLRTIEGSPETLRIKSPQGEFELRLPSISNALGLSSSASFVSQITENTPQERIRNLTDAFWRGELQQIASGLKDEKLRAEYTDSKISDRKLIRVLNYATTEQIYSLVDNLCKVSFVNREVGYFLSGKLDNILNYASASERQHIVESFMSSEKSTYGAQFIAQIMRSCESRDELSSLVAKIGSSKLLGLKDQNVTEYTALSVLGGKLTGTMLPSSISENASETTIRSTLDSLSSALKRAMDIVDGDSSLKDTDTAKEYREGIVYNQGIVDDAKTSKWTDTKQAAQAVNSILTRMKLEFLYGLQITNEDGKFLSDKAAWNQETLSDLTTALSRLPLGAVLFAPHLKEIRRVTYIDMYVLGARYMDGLIRIADYALHHPSIDREYPGMGSLQACLTHEIGHGVQLGREYGGVKSGPDGADSFTQGQGLYDFLEFAKLSGWEIVPSSRYTLELDQDGYIISVVLDGKSYKLRETIEHNGQRLVLSYGKGVLMSRDADAQFTKNDYSKTNPWEDWAEAWTEYCMKPERMIQFAPKKFAYFESEFRKYRDKLEGGEYKFN